MQARLSNGEFIALIAVLFATIAISIALILVGCLAGVVFARSITRPIAVITSGLSAEADNMSGFADEISRTSETLVLSARSQSAAVDGAACSILRSIDGGTAGASSATPIAPHAE